LAMMLVSESNLNADYNEEKAPAGVNGLKGGASDVVHDLSVRIWPLQFQFETSC